MVTLNRAVAVAMVDGPRAGLALLGTLDADERMTHTHRLDAVRAHLLDTGSVGPYQLQAAIAAVHDEASTRRGDGLAADPGAVRRARAVSPGPVVTLNRAVAVAMVHGPRAGLALLGTLDSDERMAHTHRVEAVRGHLLELAGEAGRGPGVLPEGGPDDREPPRAALPVPPGGPPGLSSPSSATALLRSIAMERARRIGLILGPILVGLAGAALALQAFAKTTIDAGPFQVQLEADFGRSVTDISLPPLGRLRADTHVAPLHLRASLREVDVEQLQEGLRRGVDSVAAEVEGTRSTPPDGSPGG